MFSQQTVENTKTVIDWISVSTVVATLLGWLPHLAALFTAVWGFFRMLNEYEDWKKRREEKKEWQS